MSEWGEWTLISSRQQLQKANKIMNHFCHILAFSANKAQVAKPNMTTLSQEHFVQRTFYGQNDVED